MFAKKQMIGRFSGVFFFVMLAAGFLPAAPQQIDTAAAESQYRDRYADREAQVKTFPDQRQMLADELHAEVAKTADKAMKLVLIERAYYWASQQRESYKLAAQAIQQMQDIDRTRRLQSLEKLETLYDKAYSENARKNLGNGIGLADVRYKMGQQRLADLIVSFEDGEVAKEEFLSKLNKSKREFIGAESVVRAVLGTATGYTKRAGVSEGQKKAILDFVEKHQPLAAQIDAAQAELVQLQADFLAGRLVPPAKPVAPATPQPPVVAEKPQEKSPPLVEAEKPVAPVVPAALPKSPESARVPASPSGGSDGAVATGSLLQRTRVCDKCSTKFIPESGSDSVRCFWCRSDVKSIFDFGDQ